MRCLHIERTWAIRIKQLARCVEGPGTTRDLRYTSRWRQALRLQGAAHFRHIVALIKYIMRYWILFILLDVCSLSDGFSFFCQYMLWECTAIWRRQVKVLLRLYVRHGHQLFMLIDIHWHAASLCFYSGASTRHHQFLHVLITTVLVFIAENWGQARVGLLGGMMRITLKRGLRLVYCVVALLVLAIISCLHEVLPINLWAIIKVRIRVDKLIGPFRSFAPFDFSGESCARGLFFCAYRWGSYTIDLIVLGTSEYFGRRHCYDIAWRILLDGKTILGVGGTMHFLMILTSRNVLDYEIQRLFTLFLTLSGTSGHATQLVP